jgi:hypothetical protein
MKKDILFLLFSQRVIARCHLERGPIVLRLRYSRGLKTRNDHGSGSLRTPFHRFWVADGHERWSWRGRGPDMVLHKSLNNSELQQQWV